MTEWGYLNPDILVEYVNFARNKPNWKYRRGDTSMPAKQAEGTAGIWNLLASHDIAILADEVGMGKTIQALSLCATLWRKMPSARVLVFAPREAVANNWANEYQMFIRSHYRHSDDLVKTSVGGEPVHKAVLCNNIYELCEKALEGWGKFFICKTTSFSYLLSGFRISDNKKRYNYQKIKEKLDWLDIGPPKRELCRTDNSAKLAGWIAARMREMLLKKGLHFELVILDEAQYYRNIDFEDGAGSSQRVNAARKFFRGRTRKLANRTLLMTATPNHSSPENIKSIVSYFDDELKQLPPEEILKKICVRRLRTLSSKGKIKYHYRHEIADPSSFEDDIRSELFFALYQKKLVEEALKDPEGAGNKNLQHGRLFYGYMEGFEFIPTDRKSSGSEETLQQDFNESSDTKILIRLARKFQKCYHSDDPSHPKYDKLIQTTSPERNYWDLGNDKSLVFVRRIPSINEISRRVMKRYDNIFWHKIRAAKGLKQQSSSKLPTRERYIRLFGKITDMDQLLSPGEEYSTNQKTDSEEHRSDTNLSVPTSSILDLFAAKTKGKKQTLSVRNTHAALFRLRFSRADSIFSIFFQHGPAMDSRPFTFKHLYRRSNKRDYFDTAGIARAEQLAGDSPERHSAVTLKNILYSNVEQNTEKLKTAETYETLWTIFWHTFTSTGFSDSSLTGNWKDLSIFEKEALAKFVMKGVLYASPALIELYCWYIETEEKLAQKKKTATTGSALYNAFLKNVKLNFASSILFRQMVACIKHFKIFHEKIICRPDSEELLLETWRFFENTYPVYPYSGNTKNNSILNAFNTPFFPDVLIATSVLQEGVNLQYFCNNVIHYGLAWTAGDNEQRVGRIDRMFGLVERMLDSDDPAELTIRYPYIENSLDEDQLSVFCKEKCAAEKLMDKCTQDTFKRSYSSEQVTGESWKDYLHQPVHEQLSYEDPYPHPTDAFTSAKPLHNKQRSIDEVISSIQHALKFSDFDVYHLWKKQQHSNLVCLLDPRTSRKRSQPVLVELQFASEFSGLVDGTIYILTMKTPLCCRNKLKHLEKRYRQIRDQNMQQYPLVQLALDDERDPSSNYYIYMKTDLPLFRDISKEGCLSDYELQTAFGDLIECADFLEFETFDDQDLTLKDLRQDATLQLKFDTTSRIKGHHELSSINSRAKLNDNWIYSDCKRYVFLEQVLENPNTQLENIWRLNHTYPFVIFYRNKKTLKARLPYPMKDIQPAESEILEKWFNYVTEYEWY